MKLGNTLKNNLHVEIKTIPSNLLVKMDHKRPNNPFFQSDNMMIQAYNRMTLYLGNIVKIINNP